MHVEFGNPSHFYKEITVREAVHTLQLKPYPLRNAAPSVCKQQAAVDIGYALSLQAHRA